MFRFLTLIFAIFLTIETFGKGNLSVVIDGKTPISAKKLTLNAGYHEVIFCLSSNNKSINSYQFYLKNLENTWKTSSFPEIRYTNLAGGSYIFYGKTLEGNKVVAEFSCEIEIKENFWEKWWFWLFVGFFVVMAIGLIIYFWFLYDFRQRMKTEQIRQKIASDLHDEVGANLSSINFLVGSLQKKIKTNDKDLQFFLEKISDNSTESATLINDTIWALNPNFDTLEKLLERIKSFASGLLSSKDIAFTIENNLPEKQVDLSIEQRQNLYFIMKEAINNVAKHAAANKVFLRISNDENGIKISIEDNGVGFDTKTIFEGNGIKNYQLRAKEGEIDVKIVSEINFGTSVEILLLTKNH